MLDIYWKEGKIGFQTKQGVHLTTARWRYAERLDDRTGIVCDGAGYALLQIHPRRLIPLDCKCADRYGTGLVRIRRNGKYGLLDRDGQIIIPAEYDMLTRHYGQFNIIGRQRKYGLLNRLGEWVRPLVYDAILPISQRGNNRFACIRRGKTEFL